MASATATHVGYALLYVAWFPAAKLISQTWQVEGSVLVVAIQVFLTFAAGPVFAWILTRKASKTAEFHGVQAGNLVITGALCMSAGIAGISGASGWLNTLSWLAAWYGALVLFAGSLVLVIVTVVRGRVRIPLWIAWPILGDTEDIGVIPAGIGQDQVHLESI